MSGRRLARFLLSAALLSLGVGAFGTGSIRLSSYPTLSVADGHSTVTISAEVRQSDGSKVADGTPVRFTASGASFRESDVGTVDGVARAVLVAPNEPGFVRITASVTSIGTVNTLDVEFVKDRAALSAARRYVEISSEASLFYSNQIGVFSAAAPSRGVRLRYGDITINASDLQLDSAGLVVVAVDAELTVGETSLECRRLRYTLPQRSGFAIATVDGRLAGCELKGAIASVAEGGVDPAAFEFRDVGTSQTSVHAASVVFFPNREIQFRHAQVFVGDTRVMSMPLYALKAHSGPELFTDQVIGFENGSLQVNYPYYLNLSPTFTSALRLRSGQNYGRGASSSRGFFLDLESTYLAGADGEGSVTLSGIGRSDMSLSFRHTQRFGERSSVSALLDFPNFNSIYGGINAYRSFKGYTATLSANSSSSFSGEKYESQRADLSVTTDRKPVPGLPGTYSVGLTMNTSRASFFGRRTEQSGYGLRAQWVMTPQRLWQGAVLTNSVTLSQLWSGSDAKPFGVVATTAVSTNLNNRSNLRLAYDYTKDSFTSSFFGSHRVTGELFWSDSNFLASVFGGRSLDMDSMNVFADVSYLLGPQWRVGGVFSLDRFRGETVEDQTLLLGYRMGLREIAITYSMRTGRFGLELLNAPFR